MLPEMTVEAARQLGFSFDKDTIDSICREHYIQSNDELTDDEIEKAAGGYVFANEAANISFESMFMLWLNS